MHSVYVAWSNQITSTSLFVNMLFEEQRRGLLRQPLCHLDRMFREGSSLMQCVRVKCGNEWRRM